jgi:hypothetical protein
MTEREHQTLLRAALAREANAQRMLLAGEDWHASERFSEVAQFYRESWESAPERAFGRLVGYLKASVLAGDGPAAAAYVRDQLGDAFDSPSSAWAIALAALIASEDALAASAAEAMAEGGDAFARTAAAVAALAAADADAYRQALEAIVADFEARADHLTGVPIADTAVVLERIAHGRGMQARVSSPLLPGSS